LNFEGAFDFQAPREKVWNFIVDPNMIGMCLPDLKTLETESEDKFRAVIRVGIGVIRGDLQFRLAILEKEPPSSVRLKSHATGPGSNVDIDVIINLLEIPAGTRLVYKTDVKVGGLMAGLAQHVLAEAAERTIKSIFECIGKQVT
jgi:hypothetical protein